MQRVTYDMRAGRVTYMWIGVAILCALVIVFSISWTAKSVEKVNEQVLSNSINGALDDYVSSTSGLAMRDVCIPLVTVAGVAQPAPDIDTGGIPFCDYSQQ